METVILFLLGTETVNASTELNICIWKGWSLGHWTIVNIYMLLHSYSCNSSRNGHGSSRTGWKTFVIRIKAFRHAKEMVKVQNPSNAKMVHCTYTNVNNLKLSFSYKKTSQSFIKKMQYGQDVSHLFLRAYTELEGSDISLKKQSKAKHSDSIILPRQDSGWNILQGPEKT